MLEPQEQERALPEDSIMVRNVDDFDFSLPSHPQAIMEGLRSLRSNPKLSDVTLLVGGHEFPCHRSILALCSHYFNAMFTGDFIESISAHVELKEVDPVVMETLIDFAYTGKITINQGNVEALIRTSNQLHFPTIRKVCSRYLRQQMDATNCLGICEFGENHGCPEVSSKAWAFLQENFEAVSAVYNCVWCPARTKGWAPSDFATALPGSKEPELPVTVFGDPPEPRAGPLLTLPLL
uniref:BTB domain-containing protein n=1 Tax=Gopherus agassizii TaxID=38772 RepID=A0A452I118_9SAUR